MITRYLDPWGNLPETATSHIYGITSLINTDGNLSEPSV